MLFAARSPQKRGVAACPAATLVDVSEDPIEQMSEKLAAYRMEQERRDPHGFYRMSERDLIDWMGEGHAQPGSVVYKQAEHVLSMKQREASQDDWNYRRTMEWTDEIVENLKRSVSPDPEPDPPDRLTEVHVSVLLLPMGVFGLVWQVTGGSILWGSVGFIATILLLAVRPIRSALVRLLNRVVG
jgi:hypothetical protein